MRDSLASHDLAPQNAITFYLDADMHDGRSPTITITLRVFDTNKPKRAYKLFSAYLLFNDVIFISLA
jgi:hypothetical protein